MKTPPLSKRQALAALRNIEQVLSDSVQYALTGNDVLLAEDIEDARRTAVKVKAYVKNTQVTEA